MHGLGQEVAHSVQRLRRSPGFTATAVLTLALGIGACTFMLNIVSGVLLSPLPFKDPSRAVMIWGYTPQFDLGYSEQPIGGKHFSAIRAT